MDKRHETGAETDLAREAERIEYVQAWRNLQTKLDLDQRIQFRNALKHLHQEVTAKFGERGGRFRLAMESAARRGCDPAERARLGLPSRDGRERRPARQLRADRFIGDNPKNLHSKEADWLFLVEEVAKVLGRDHQREVVRLKRNLIDGMAPPGGYLAEYDQIFDHLAETLRNVAQNVAIKYEMPAYYECCDRMVLDLIDGEIQENDGQAPHFSRLNYPIHGWGLSWRDEFGSGNEASDLLIRAPMGAESLVTISPNLVLAESEVSGFNALDGSDQPPFLIEFRVSFYLAIRCDTTNTRDIAALLVHPVLRAVSGQRVLARSLFADELENGVSEQERDGLASFKRRFFELPDGRQRLIDALHVWRPSSWEKAHLIAQCAGNWDEILLLPMTGAVCRDWLSCGDAWGFSDDTDVSLLGFGAGEFGLNVDHEPVSAPIATLAASIQRNLAYSGDSSVRIDRQLEADAKQKVEKVRKLLASKRAGYLKALEAAGLMPATESEGL